MDAHLEGCAFSKNATRSVYFLVLSSSDVSSIYKQSNSIETSAQNQTLRVRNAAKKACLTINK
ncbi:hypothetical protein COOONC_18238 [Cooperia oncophora]